MATLKAEGITPIAVGSLWSQKQLLETVLLGELGADTYTGLWDGTTDWHSAAVKAALTIAGRVFVNSDVKAPSGEWQSTMAKTVKKNQDGAAYTVMSDWAYAQNIRDGLNYKTDFDFVPSPGTDGIYDFHVDSFVLPKNAAHNHAGQQWLIECGSADIQSSVSPATSGLAARTDAGRSPSNAYLSQTLADWNNPGTKIVGSLAHGVVTNADMSAQIDTALTSFIQDRDPDAFGTAVMKAYQDTK